MANIQHAVLSKKDTLGETVGQRAKDWCAKRIILHK